MAIDMTSDPKAIELGYVIAHHNNFFIKYSPSLCLGYFGLIFIIYPYLMVKNIMSLGEFLVAGERIKSKIYLIVYSLFLPGIIFLILTVSYSNDFTQRGLYLAIVLLSILYIFVKNSYIYFVKHNDKNT
jgi:hypothetical protein